MDQLYPEAVGPVTEAAATPDALGSLPRDCRLRLDVLFDALAEHGLAWSDARIHDDGSVVAATCTANGPPEVVERALQVVESLLSDFRVLPAGEAESRVDARLWRDGRSSNVEHVVGLHDPWPTGSCRSFGVDCSNGLLPGHCLELLESVRELRRRGRELHLINLPESLRLFAEAQGYGPDLPTRTRSGPRLPPVLQALWHDPVA